MINVKYMLISAREEIKKTFIDDFKADQYVRVIDHLKKIILTKLCLVTYYLNPVIQYWYTLGTQHDSLMALRNVVYRILPNATDVAEALAESRYFREAIGLFSDAIVVSCRYTMDLDETNYTYCLSIIFDVNYL
ncbi:hypothetical protein GW17_00056334 [Ensete ventricosum]|nr:hypothetical protein GW17_00056334 [Ensete ventricosum]